MRISPSRVRTVALATGCVALGAGAGAIASAGAATHHSVKVNHRAQHAGAGHRLRRLRSGAGGAIQGTLVVPTSNGTSFATISFDRGFVAAVSGQQLTINEGTAKATYKAVTLTIPTSATVRNNRTPAALGSLTKGERVAVVQGVKKEWVIAHSAPAGS
jgi:hypothetical protein